MAAFPVGPLAFALVPNGDAWSTCAAWLLALTWCAACGLPWLARGLRASDTDHRGDARAVAGLFALGFALRLALPWGPVNFGEAERLDVLWSAAPGECGPMSTVPSLGALLLALGVPLAGLLRVVPQCLGALTAVGCFLTVRAVGGRRESALVAGAVALGWPAHLHYSTSPTFTVEGTALWSLAFAAAAVRSGVIPWRAPLLAALAVLAVYARPEYRLLLVPLALVGIAAPWTLRERVVFALCAAVGFAPYLRHLPPGEMMAWRSTVSRFFIPHLKGDAQLSPFWWLYLGAAGVLAGLTTRSRAALAVALALAVATLLWVYSFLASEANPRWSQWRYYTSLVPFVAVAVGLLADRVASPSGAAWRQAVAPALLTLAALTPLARWSALRRAEDLSSEFAYLRATAPRVLAQRPDVLVLTNTGRPALASVRVEAMPRMALATVHRPLEWPVGCEPAVNPSTPRLRDLETVVAQCPETVSATRSVVYLGLSRDDARLEGLRARFTLVPLDERRMRVAPSVTAINLQCPLDPSVTTGVAGLDLDDCAVRLGWYRLQPRNAP